MSSYCECGHVLGMHADSDSDNPGFCCDPDDCGCEMFSEVSPEQLERGWD